MAACAADNAAARCAARLADRIKEREAEGKAKGGPEVVVLAGGYHKFAQAFGADETLIVKGLPASSKE